MEFRILGPLEVVEQGRTLPLGGGKQLALFALLLLHGNEVLSTDRLVDELWGDRQPATAAKIVRNYVSLLRKEVGDRLVTRQPGYLLRVEPGELDSERFELLVREAREQEPAAAGATLRQALALWAGPPLAQLAYESFAQGEAARLEELRLQALEDRLDADLQLGRDRELVPELEQLVRAHPLRERPRALLMLALYRAGRQADALAVYQDARRALLDELGLEPSPVLQDLQRRILSHDADLAGPPRRGWVAARRRRGGVIIATGGVILLAAGLAAGVVELTGSSAARLSAVASNSVGVIDARTNRIVAQLPVGAAPTRISAGRGGLWVINQADATLSRIDYRTHAVRTISVPDTPTAVAADAGAVWLLSGQQTSNGTDPFAGAAEVSKIVEAPSIAVLKTTPIGALVGNTFEDAITASSGEIWARDPGTLTRINPTTAKVTDRYQVGSTDATPEAVAIADRSVWVLDSNGLLRIDPRTGTQLAQIQAGASPVALAAGAGAIWVASRPASIYKTGAPKQIGRATLSRIDPASNTVVATIELPGIPTAIAIGEGSVWISDDSNRAIVTVDASSDRLARSIHLGSRPEGIAVANGSIWVATQ